MTAFDEIDIVEGGGSAFRITTDALVACVMTTGRRAR